MADSGYQKAVAPIKAEYRVAVSQSSAQSSAVAVVVGAKRDAPDDATPTPTEPDPAVARPKARGMNKSRKPFKPEATGVKMCTAVLTGGTCRFGDTCRFSHDLAAYAALRPPDLGQTCPIYTLRGECRFGAACRFGAEHVDPTTGVSRREPPATPPYEEINIIGHDLVQALRKRQIDFKVTDARAEAFSADVQRQIDTSHGKPKVVEEVKEEVAGEKAGDASTEATELSSYHSLAASSDAVPPRERKHVDFRGKLYLAPLTTVGNLPFRRVCKAFGADITCGEMALGTSLLQGHATEWALLRRHPCEDVFGVQVAGNQAQAMGRVAQLIEERCNVDFVDINMGCPIDAVCNKGMGASLACRPGRVQSVVKTMSQTLSCPLTVKMRVGYDNDTPIAHKLIPKVALWGAAAVTLHGRSRQQRYHKNADWSFIRQCADIARDAPCADGACGIPLIGNGDVFSFEDVHEAMLRASSGESDSAPASSPLDHVSSVMLARGALVKPWVFTEIKERRHWDISATERLDILKDFTKFGLEHWGTDDIGVARVRKFLLEWLSFLHRYVPVGLLERLPGRLQDRPPAFRGRNDMETLMASPNAADWVRITEILLGPVPDGFTFVPKHKANAYETGPIDAEG